MRLWLWVTVILFCQACSQVNVEQAAYNALQKNQEQRCLENRAPCLEGKKYGDYQRERGEAVQGD